jgi:flagellar biosynthetic protein FlhB
MADSQDRNLPATARKKSQAREQGQVARSRDLGHFAAIAIGGYLLVALAPDIAAWLKSLMVEGLSFDAKTLAEPRVLLERASSLGVRMLFIVLPMGAIMAGVGVGTAWASGGWNFTMQPLQPNFAKLNPFTGITKLFSKDQLVGTLKASLLALILGGIGAMYLQSKVEVFAAALNMPLPASLAHALQSLLGGLTLLVIALGLFAAVDVPLQRFQLGNQLKMSHSDVKQEHKELEGNQEVKGKIKVRMREISKRRMLAAVPNADLVVMNPTHYAVALKYDDATMSAPRVIAKGADLLALRIRDIARESKVPVLEAPPLARALYAHAEVDREIPAALFSAVAQVLAYVYQLRAALGGKGKLPGDLPDLPVPAELDPHNKPPAKA